LSLAVLVVDLTLVAVVVQVVIAHKAERALKQA
jgi:hypothetical protein